ncbi:hypothetical protein K432DRAFT_445636 [Lepidopterella palustris CBS 459.81]|uniref:Large ribosomal subunit protein mL50 n=1 Tax=Lepidopterella palustris CBS 459.81 TaxID=1314670 RepID=A0A8E2JCJ3_9PEZI|nr:hypothetical protein K432DRAFT_445636 [Lepidopterella palustris CBS 459.81]
MRRIRPSQQSIDSLSLSTRHAHSRLSSPLCYACQFHSSALAKSRHPSSLPVAAFSTSSARLHRGTGGKEPFTEKLRKKIWGTDDVPGRVDPYSHDSPMRVTAEERRELAEQGRKRAKEERRLARGEESFSADELTEVTAGAQELAKKGRSTARRVVEENEWWESLGKRKEYEPAHTWDGLERVGGKAWVDEFKDWKRGRVVFEQGYLPLTKITDSTELKRSLHRALVEVFTLQQAGLDMTIASVPGEIQARPGWMDRVKIGPSNDNASAAVIFQDPAHKSELLDSLIRRFEQQDDPERSLEERVATEEDYENGAAEELYEEVAAEASEAEALKDLAHESQQSIAELREDLGAVREAMTARGLNMTAEEPNLASEKSRKGDETTASPSDVEANQQKKSTKKQEDSWAKDWKTISLEDPNVKFAVVKRVMQLTGHRIPDIVIQECKTVGRLFDRISERPKPKKLIEAIQPSAKFKELANVKIYNRRVTPVDKEKEVGRWKVIEYALRERGLPVVGHE